MKEKSGRKSNTIILLAVKKYMHNYERHKVYEENDSKFEYNKQYKQINKLT